MSQVAMRAPTRGHASVVVEGIPYAVSETGVVTVHDVHVKALRSLGFHQCSEETSDVPDLVSLSAADFELLKAAKAAQASSAKPDAASASALAKK